MYPLVYKCSKGKWPCHYLFIVLVRIPLQRLKINFPPAAKPSDNHEMAGSLRQDKCIHEIMRTVCTCDTAFCWAGSPLSKLGLLSPGSLREAPPLKTLKGQKYGKQPGRMWPSKGTCLKRTATTQYQLTTTMWECIYTAALSYLSTKDGNKDSYVKSCFHVDSKFSILKQLCVKQNTSIASLWPVVWLVLI